ncbi:MAG: helix-turn-helix transcriptional regulator [Lachnospiraceae bacterium]|nr:helix-turn-helix transcriptional regulator [Lachnospiraceae bacterium]
MEQKKNNIIEECKSADEIEIPTMNFGLRLRQIRKELGETQDEFAARIGTSKQVLSRYESGQRTPKISLVEKYAQSLQVSVDYLMGQGDQEGAFDSICIQNGQPFYKIFIEVTTEMGLGISDIVRITGLTDRQVRTIILRRMKEAPLPVALQLSRTLDVPLEVWTGNEVYKKGAISVEGREVAMAYDKAARKDKNMVRMALDLPPLTEERL